MQTRALHCSSLDLASPLRFLALSGPLPLLTLVLCPRGTVGLEWDTELVALGGSMDTPKSTKPAGSWGGEVCVFREGFVRGWRMRKGGMKSGRRE